jgi:hypothetical protein
MVRFADFRCNPSQVTLRRSFSFQIFLNKPDSEQVFMIEGRQLVAGEAILSGAATIQRDEDQRSRAKSDDDVLEAFPARLPHRLRGSPQPP